jgi:hypothetical protein
MIQAMLESLLAISTRPLRIIRFRCQTSTSAPVSLAHSSILTVAVEFTDFSVSGSPADAYEAGPPLCPSRPSAWSSSCHHPSQGEDVIRPLGNLSTRCPPEELPQASELTSIWWILLVIMCSSFQVVNPRNRSTFAPSTKAGRPCSGRPAWSCGQGMTT